MIFPPRTPSCLFIDPCGLCNFNCTFCPCNVKHRHLWSINRQVQVMPLDLFQNIINSMNFPDKISRLCLYKEGEPLMNPQIAHMISIAKKANVANIICIVSNGSLLTSSLSQQLIEAGLDELCISIIGLSNEEYFYRGSNYSLDSICNNIEYFYKNKTNTKVFLKVLSDGFSDMEKEKIKYQFNGLCDAIIFYQPRQIWNDFNALQSFESISECDTNCDRAVCSELFDTMVVNSNGTVSACCVDWNWDLLLGDAKETPLQSIWMDKPAMNLRKTHLNAKRWQLPNCASCQVLQESSVSYDLHRKTLLKCLEKTEQLLEKGKMKI